MELASQAVDHFVEQLFPLEDSNTNDFDSTKGLEEKLASLVLN